MGCELSVGRSETGEGTTRFQCCAGGGLSGHWMEMLFLLGPAAGGHWRRQEKRRPGLQALVGRRFLQYAKRSQEQWGISA